MMKFILCFVLLVNVVRASDEYWLRDELGHNRHGYAVSPGLAHYSQQENDKYQREEHVNLQAPCSIHDISCIRHFLISHGLCVRGPSSDPYIVKKLALHVPHSNVTVTINNAQVQGIKNGRVEEFYVNKKTDSLVLEVIFDRLVIFSPRTVVSYHRKGREPIETIDYSVIEIKKLSLTLVVKNLNNPHLRENHISAYVSDAYPDMELGEGHEHTKGISKGHLDWIYRIGLTVREAMVQQAPVYLQGFLQTKICPKH